MAVVYKAVQEPLGREVAIKALKPSIAIDSHFAERFEREALFLAAMQHENILHVYDFIKDARSMYIIMEFVEGVDLRHLLDTAPLLPVDIAAIIALKVARALDYAHFRGIVHRDVKPANIMINRQGEVKLTDFGIAREESERHSMEPEIGVGSPNYMSPEQILGDDIDFRTDIFSLGVSLYEMLTGERPFVEDDTRTVMQKIRLDHFRSPRRANPAIPRSLERILGRCMEKMPVNRYTSTQALIDDLTEFIATRVPAGYNAKIVSFLGEVDVLGEVEAEEILGANAERGVRRRRYDDRMLRGVFFSQAAFFLSIVLAGSLIQDFVLTTNSSSESDQAPDISLAQSSQRGLVRFVVEPWAHVFVDGVQVTTTPSAMPISLSPGRRWLRFQNPFYTEEVRQVEVVPGDDLLIQVTLSPLPTDAPENENAQPPEEQEEP